MPTTTSLRSARSLFLFTLLVAMLLLTVGVGSTMTSSSATASAEKHAELSLIIQAADFQTAIDAARAAGGEITPELPIIQAVAATVNTEGQRLLEARGDLQLHVNHQLEMANTPGSGLSGGASDEDSAAPADAAPGDEASDSTDASARYNIRRTPLNHHITAIEADELHDDWILGRGVTVAVVDSGLTPFDGMVYGANGRNRLLAQYDALEDAWYHGYYASWVDTDGYGHGTHVASLAVSSAFDNKGTYQGAAPNAGLVAVKIFDEQGLGSYADAIRGLSWVLACAEYYGIRVVNLSFSAPVRSHYWQDPLNQAVMELWNAGVMVVTSAGNQGPEPLSIGVPGNVPYVVTVGASTDIGRAKRTILDEVIPDYSSAGPTTEGHIKPDMVAPGGHIYGFLDRNTTLASLYNSDRKRRDYQKLSGTSQASAVTAGAAALLISDKPWLSADDVKCRLLATARGALNEDGTPAYSVFTQGAGLIDVEAALDSHRSGCANVGLDIRSDVLDIAHFGGPANLANDGTYFLEGFDPINGLLWDGTFVESTAYQWSTGQIWADAYQWSTGQIWADTYQWSTGQIWADSVINFDWPSAVSQNDQTGLPSGLSSPAGANAWMPHR
ncbi:MAG: S8 family serine peptidase [Acidobacteriota bacterium]